MEFERLTTRENRIRLMTRNLWRCSALLLVLSPLFSVAQFRQKSAGAAIAEATRDTR